MPKGDEEEIVIRGVDLFRFVALLATCALLDRPHFGPVVESQPLRLMASVPSISSPRCWELCLALRAYANLVADARLHAQHFRAIAQRLGFEPKGHECGERIWDD
jgi:hypothetical protein